VLPLNSTFQCDTNDILYMSIFKYLLRKKREKSNGRSQIYDLKILNLLLEAIPKRYHMSISVSGNIKIPLKLAIHGSVVMTIEFKNTFHSFEVFLHLNALNLSISSKGYQLS
jgi:hypothetical protein